MEIRPEIWVKIFACPVAGTPLGRRVGNICATANCALIAHQISFGKRRLADEHHAPLIDR